MEQKENAALKNPTCFLGLFICGQHPSSNSITNALHVWKLYKHKGYIMEKCGNQVRAPIHCTEGSTRPNTVTTSVIFTTPFHRRNSLSFACGRLHLRRRYLCTYFYSRNVFPINFCKPLQQDNSCFLQKSDKKFFAIANAFHGTQRSSLASCLQLVLSLPVNFYT